MTNEAVEKEGLRGGPPPRRREKRKEKKEQKLDGERVKASKKKAADGLQKK